MGNHLIATNMEHAIRIVSVERGRDPRRYAMVAFGGAGPLHAARLARKIGVPQVIIPKNAGVGSAVGLLGADARLDASATRLLRLNETTGDTLRELYEELEERVLQDLERMALRVNRSGHVSPTYASPVRVLRSTYRFRQAQSTTPIRNQQKTHFDVPMPPDISSATRKPR